MSGQERLPSRPERAFSTRHKSRGSNKESPQRSRKLKPTKESPEQAAKEAQIKTIIQDYVQDQKYLKDVGIYQEFGEKIGGDLFQAYEDTDSFMDICKEAGKLRKNPDVVGRMKGKLFADIAFHVLSEKESGIVLPPEAILDIAKVLYPDTGVSKQPFDQSSLRGEYVPDGLLVNEDGKITKIYEYKLNDDKKIRNQEKRSGKFISDMRRFLSPDPKLTIVTPENGNKSHMSMPFSTKQFDRYFRPVFNSIPTPEYTVFEG
jgi:hypothetical protein